MKKKIFLFIFIAIFFIGIVSAVGGYDRETETRFIGKQGNILTIYDTCTNDGIDCGASYNCNFTIIKPNNDILINNLQSTKVGNLYLYNLSANQTEDLGLYEVNSYCYNSTEAGRLTFYYEITYTGNESTPQMIYIYILAIVILLLLIIFIAYSIRGLPSSDTVDDSGSILQVNQLKHLRPILWGVCWTIGLVILFIISNLGIAYLPNEMIGKLFFALYQIFFWITIIGIPLWFIWIFVKIWKDKEVKRLLERGVDMKASM